MTDTRQLSAAALRRLSVEAHVDPRTVARVAAGLPVRGDAGARARAALVAAGYPVPETLGRSGALAAATDSADKEAASAM